MPAPPTPRRPAAVRVFVQRFSSTPLGARLARHLALHELDRWNIPYGTERSDTAAVIIAELAANAVTHGRVPGRGFELRMSLTPGTVWIEVSDTGTAGRPTDPAAVEAPPPLADCGRGLALVDALADRWAVWEREPLGTTVCAELDLRRRSARRPSPPPRRG